MELLTNIARCRLNIIQLSNDSDVRITPGIQMTLNDEAKYINKKKKKGQSLDFPSISEIQMSKNFVRNV